MSSDVIINYTHSVVHYAVLLYYFIINYTHKHNITLHCIIVLIMRLSVVSMIK